MCIKSNDNICSGTYDQVTISAPITCNRFTNDTNPLMIPLFIPIPSLHIVEHSLSI